MRVRPRLPRRVGRGRPGRAGRSACAAPTASGRAPDIFEEEAIQRFDDTLDRGTEALVSDLRQLTRANMEEDVERFVSAITAGHVLPEDF